MQQLSKTSIMVDAGRDSEVELNSPYAPINLRNKHWWRYALEAAKDGFVMANGRIASNLVEMMQEDLAGPYIEAFAEVVKDESQADELIGIQIAKVSLLRHWVPMIGQYELCGRQIFDFSADLVQLLDHTDVSDCTLSDWVRPYDAFYMRFGKQDAIKLPFDDGIDEYLDGAFVACTPYGDDPDEYRLKFAFTTVKDDGSRVALPGCFIDFTPTEQRMFVPDAIKASIARKNAEMQEDGASESVKAISAYRIDQLNETASLVSDAAVLLINSLYYLESLGNSNVGVVPGEDVPEPQRVKWEQATPKQKNKMRSALTAAGYTLVRPVGIDAGGDHRSYGNANATREAHWRRGHWRWQRHGEGYSLKKRVWIKPVLVSGSLATGEIRGHVYKV